VDVEAGVRPGENALGPFRAQQLLADKHRQDLAGEDLGETRVVDPHDRGREIQDLLDVFDGHDLAEVLDHLFPGDLPPNAAGEERRSP
jgi:hypothetical protein